MDKVFQQILQYGSVPGNETNLRDYLIKQFQAYGKITKTKWTGFYCDWKGNKTSKNRPTIVITAHMDSPGFIVQNINSDGSLKIISLGGLAPSKMNLRTVTLQTSTKSYSGILTLPTASDRPSEASYEGFFGFSSEKEAQKAGVRKGDSVYFLSPILEMENQLICAPHVDNRVGIYLMLMIAKKLPKNLDCNIYFAATSCEEVGGRCAKIIADMLAPDLAICLDVTYEEQDIKMGKGPVLTLSDDASILPAKVRDKVAEIAQAKKIPLQFEVYNYAGTDAKDFRAAPGGGCLTLPILLATLNNHSPHEIFSMKDMQSTAKLVWEVLKRQGEIEV